ncbi:hypothetical protein [Actinoplanes friuliensis]|uniref:Uncharacterized protein n=1 Tax=Actinoplanes friuliensis DSM 7358 TaxID=1246995 RepID=U5W0Y3_9ACTN|nr:hypothetical protein [Actinoplanes friuliensis]AGZ41546.1 hypothetical protein AFR_16320 [Actinoplanes friuliensis DSM 7358]
MTEMIVVRWADLAGTGFSRHEPKSAPPAYWAVAERLLRSDLSQPPEAFLTTIPHPIWTLRHLDVEGRGHWCFAVQGRKGPFGVAGGCRFGFVPDEVLPAEAWELGREQVAPEDSAVAPQAPSDLIEGVLGGVCRRQSRLPVGNDPATAAAVIGAALRVVPTRIARQWTWSTCLLFRPEAADRWVIAGLWPPEFEHSDRVMAGRMAQHFRTPAPRPSDLHHEQDGELLARCLPDLARYAQAGIALDPALLLTAEDMRPVLDHVARNELPITVHDLPAAFFWPNGLKRLRDDPRVLHEWVELDWRAARRGLTIQNDPKVRTELFEALLELQDTTSENVLGFPTPSEPPDPVLADLLAAMLLKGARQAKDRARYLEELTEPGGPLADVRDLRALHTWFQEKLSLSPRTFGRLYPPRPDAVVAMINEAGTLTEDAKAELKRSEDRLQIVSEAASRLTAMDAGEAAHLIDFLVPKRRPELSAARRDQVARLTTILVSRAASPADWLADLLTKLSHLNRGDLQVPVTHGGLAALQARGVTTLWNHPELHAIVEGIPVTDDMPAEVRALMVQAQQEQVPVGEVRQRVTHSRGPARLREDLSPSAEFPESRAAIYRSSPDTDDDEVPLTSRHGDPESRPFLRRRSFAVAVGATLILVAAGILLALRDDKPVAHNAVAASQAPSRVEPVTDARPTGVTLRTLKPPLNPQDPSERHRQFILDKLGTDLEQRRLVIAVVLTGQTAPGAALGEGEEQASLIAASLRPVFPENPPIRVREAQAEPGTVPGTVIATVILMDP